VKKNKVRATRAGLWLRHCRQMPRAYDDEGPTKYGGKIFWRYVTKL